MSQAMGQKLKLMVVDDEPDNLDLLYRTFRRNFKVFLAHSALEALKILKTEGEMAIIISDQRMPLMNGTEFLSKTVEEFPDTIRILLTGYTDVSDLVDAINTVQVFKYITKPWKAEQLKGVVEQAADTYNVLKQRTNELRRALRRESLLNAVTSAIRESLDYSSMLQTIVTTLSQTFDATSCLLRPVERDRLARESFSYPPENPKLPECVERFMEEVLGQQKTKFIQRRENDNSCTELAVPLIYQQQTLAVLFLYQNHEQPSWLAEDIQLIEGVSEQAALAMSQAKLYQRTQQQAEQMRAELQVARQIQNNLLRQSWQDVEGVRIQACCEAAKEVGGDFFEVFVHPQGDIWLAVGDVSGKGVPAALFMASAISVLRRELAQETPPEPDVVMDNLNNSLSADLISTERFITMVLARYTPSTRNIVYANAGHIYPLVWSHQRVVQQEGTADKKVSVEPNFIKTRSIPLGILPSWRRAVGQITLKPGEIFLITSDGISEATLNYVDSDRQEQNSAIMLTQEGLWQMLLEEPAPFDLNRLLTHIRERTKDIQEDDQTLLSLEVL